MKRPGNAKNSISNKSFVEKTITAAERNPGLRFVAALIPGASAIEGLLNAHSKNLEEDREKRFFEHLAKRDVVLSRDDLNDDFIHKYMITIAAVRRTHRKEKIECFGNMLAGGRREVTSVDVYEESLRFIDDLSVREFDALRILEEFEFTNPVAVGENDLQRASKFWPDFLAALENATGIEPQNSPAFLQGIARSGCYLEITGSYWDYTGGKGYTTPRYQQIKKICV